MKTSALKFLSLVAIVVLVSSCGSSQQRSGLETAKLAYADASLAYEATMQSLVDLRAAHKVTDAQWQQVDYLQAKVQAAQPIVRGALTLWQSSGTQPVSYAAASKEVSDALAFLFAILQEVKK